MTNNNTMTKKTIVYFVLATLLLTFVPMFSTVNAKTEIYSVNVKPQYMEVNINWHTSQVAIGELQYGLTEASLPYKVTSSTLTDWHNYTVKGLTAGTTYAYRLVVKDKQGVEQASQEGTFETWGAKPSSQTFWQFFYLNFDKDFYSLSNKYPSEMLNSENIKLTTPAVGGYALKVTAANSHLVYNAENTMDPTAGSVVMMLRFDNFNKNMVVWQTNDSRFALYFEHGVGYNRLVARAGYDSKKEGKQEAYYYLDTTSNSKSAWKAGEWHQVGMTWEGTLSGVVKIYVDGEVKDEARYTNASGASTFMIGNNYRHDMNWSEGEIDDFKFFKWTADSTSMRNESTRYAIIRNQSKGQVAGVAVRYFKTGKLIKAPDNKIYVIGRDNTKIHVTDISALNRLGKRTPVVVTWDELAQYAEGSEFSAVSNYPDGTLLKGSGPTVYWIWNNKAGVIANETVFYRYGNAWSDVLTISDAELSNYVSGLIYY